MEERPSFRSSSWRAAAAALALASAGCAGAPVRKEIVWPDPPETARIRYVRAFKTERDLESPGGFSSTMRVLAPGSSEAVVAQPSGLALTKDEKHLFVACESRVLDVDLAGGRIRLFANAEGKRPIMPFAVALDADDSVYVTDMKSNAIWVYDRAGQLLRKIESARLERPTGLAVDPRRQLLYVVSGVTQASQNHRVEVFSLRGEHLRTIGTRGGQPGNFNFPANLMVARDGRLFVVDMLNFRVQVFDADGRLEGMFGQIGAGQPGTFNKAKGIAMDAFGNVYVSDSESGMVQIFNDRFQVLMAFSGRSTERGGMLLPTAIAIDSRNDIFVADFALGAVHEFQLINTTAADSHAPADQAPAPAGAPATPAPSPARPPGE